MGLSFTGSITHGWNTVAYRVRAYDALNEHSGYTASPTRTLINNSAPVVSGADEALGVKNEAFSKTYTVSDPEGDGITVTELLDGKALRTFAATAGAEHTASIDTARMQKLLNGSHTLAVRAADAYAGGSMQSTRSWTFEKQVHRLTARSAQPFLATEMPTRCIINVGRQVPFGAMFKVEVCNNGFDAEPTWEDCTTQVENGRKYMFTNSTKTAESWGVHVRVTLERSSAVGDCYITGIGGNFE